MKGMSQRFFGVASVMTARDCRAHLKAVQQPLGLGGHGSAPGGADVAERTVDAGIRLLCAPPKIYLADRPGEPEPHG